MKNIIFFVNISIKFIIPLNKKNCNNIINLSFYIFAKQLQFRPNHLKNILYHIYLKMIRSKL